MSKFQCISPLKNIISRAFLHSCNLPMHLHSLHLHLFIYFHFHPQIFSSFPAKSFERNVINTLLCLLTLKIISFPHKSFPAFSRSRYIFHVPYSFTFQILPHLPLFYMPPPPRQFQVPDTSIQFHVPRSKSLCKPKLESLLLIILFQVHTVLMQEAFPFQD